MKTDKNMLQGQGTKEEPFLINNKNDLQLMNLYFKQDNLVFFTQKSDIIFDINDYWEPLGSTKLPVNIMYDGNNFKIENLQIKKFYTDYIGFIGYGENIIIKNLSLINLNIIGQHNVGGIIGYSEYAYIDNCFVSGKINSHYNAGLLIGKIGIISLIYNSHTRGELYGSIVGGLIGCGKVVLYNSYYSYEKVRINNKQILTAGGIFNNQYLDWLENNKSLNIKDYLKYDPEKKIIFINELNDLRMALPFFHLNYSFYLTCNLDFINMKNFNIPYFHGNFNGQGYKILNYSFNSSCQRYTGFFGYVYNSCIENLGIENANVSGEYTTGILIGFACFIKNDMYKHYNVFTEKANKHYNILNDHTRTYIKQNYVMGKVIGKDSVGGVIGEACNCISIYNCYSIGKAYSLNDNKINKIDNIGGIIGKSGWDITAKYCYTSFYLRNQYSKDCGLMLINALFGSVPYKVVKCFFNSTLISLPKHGMGIPAIKLKTEKTFKHWNFKTIWNIDKDINQGLPYMKIFKKNIVKSY